MFSVCWDAGILFQIRCLLFSYWCQQFQPHPSLQKHATPPPPHKLFDYLVCFRSPGIEMALIGEKPNPNNPVVFFDITVGNMVRMQWFQDSVKVGYFFVLKYTGNIRIHAHRFCWSNHGSLKYEPFVDQCFLLLSLIAALLLFQEIGRIKFELFADVVPRTAENFRLV